MNRPTFNLSSQIPLTFLLHALPATVVPGGCGIGGRQRPTARVLGLETEMPRRNQREQVCCLL
ncbi:hypothetical protein Hanom_Chr14g01317971 [Helianthus anomalus]